MLRKLVRKILGLHDYVSELDQFLTAFDHTHRIPSRSQKKEIVKYQRIYALRDHVAPQKPARDTLLWDQF